MACRIFRKYTPESTFELEFNDDQLTAYSRIIEGLGKGQIGTYRWHIGEILDCSELGYDEITDMDAFARVKFDEEQKAKVARQAKRESTTLKCVSGKLCSTCTGCHCANCKQYAKLNEPIGVGSNIHTIPRDKMATAYKVAQVDIREPS